MLWVSAAAEITRAKVLSVSSWWKCSPVGCHRIHLRWLRCLWAVEGMVRPGTATRHHWCGGRRREWWAWLRCPWVVAGPGPARHSDQAPLVWRAPEGPEGTGGLRGAAPNEVRPPSLAGGRAIRRPEHPWDHKQPSGTGRRHDPRLGRQGTQSCNPESIRNVGGATRPGHSQG